MIAAYEASRHGPENRLSLHRHPEVSREVVEEIHLILQENQGDFLLELVAAVKKVDVLRS